MKLTAVPGQPTLQKKCIQPNLNKQRFQLHPLKKGIRLAMLCVAMSVPVSGMLLSNPVQAQVEQRQYAFDIEAGSLESVLVAFSTFTGITVSFTPDVVDGLTSPGTKGTYGPNEAFAILLQGSGLEARAQGNGSYSVVRPSSTNSGRSGVSELAPAIVNSTSSNITEGTDSYTIGAMASATGLEISIRETPQSVTVLTNQLLVNQDVQDIGHALRLTPGVSTQTSGPGYETFRVRGFNLNTLQMDGQTFKQLGNNSSYQFFSFNTASVDHIEVVRGATGLTTGSGDPSGVVNVVRKHGGDSFAASIKTSVANYKAYSVELDVGGPLTATGTVRGRAVVGYDDQNDHIQGYFSQNKPVFYGVIDADIGEHTLVSLSLDYQEVNQDGLAFYAAIPGNINKIRFDPPRSLNLSAEWERGDIQQQSATLSLTHTFANNWNLRAAYSDRSGETDLKYFGYIRPTSSENLRFFAQKDQSSFDANVFDLKVYGSFGLLGKQHDLVLGYNQSTQTTDSINLYEGDETSFARFSGNTYNVNLYDFDPGIVPEVFDFNKVRGSELDAKQSAFYVNSKLNLAEPLSLLLGARLSNYAQDNATTLFYQTVGGPPSPLPAGRDGGVDSYDHNNVFTPYVGLVYNIGDSTSVYASYTEIFELQSNSVRDSSGGLLDPIESVNYELGFKMGLFDDGLTGSIALFQIQQDNVASRAGEYTEGSDEQILYGDYYYRGDDGVVTKGVELEVSGQISPNLQLMGGYTHQEVKKADGSTNMFTPENLFKLAASYHFEGALSQLTMGGAFMWQSELLGNPDYPESYADAFQLVDFWAVYQVNEHLSARLNISNLLDEKYTDQSAGYLAYGEARRIRLSVDYRF